jgi:hypothetical protein
MVSFDREEAPGGPVIRGFSGASYRIEDRIVPGGLWLTPDDALRVALNAVTYALSH